jgi:hypothetical protein
VRASTVSTIDASCFLLMPDFTDRAQYRRMSWAQQSKSPFFERIVQRVFRRHFHQWLDAVWQEMDAQIVQVASTSPLSHLAPSRA